MPELSWAWGYQWGLVLIVFSTILPDCVVQVAGLVVVTQIPCSRRSAS